MSEDSQQQPKDRKLKTGVLALFLTVLIGIFIWKSYGDFGEIKVLLKEKPVTLAVSVVSDPPLDLDPARFEILARTALEHDTTSARHRRSESALLARTYLRFMSSVFGAILVAIGAFFVLGAVKSAPTDIKGTWREIGFSLGVNSPGIVLACLGALLMIVPQVSQQAISASDRSSFFGILGPAAAAPQADDRGYELALEKYCKEKNYVPESCQKEKEK